MIIGILGPMQEEVDALLKIVENPTRDDRCGFAIWRGRSGGVEVVIIRCGVGTVSSAAATQCLICEFGVTHLINAGIGGGLSDKLRVGHVVLSTSTEYYDVKPQSVLDDNFPNKGVYKADEALLTLAKNAVTTLGIEDIVHSGIITSGNHFVTDSVTKEAVYGNSKAMVSDMEGGSMAQVAFMNNIPFLIIRVISDMSDDSADDTYYEFKANDKKVYELIIEEMLKNI